jgi:hypothetical protein
MWLSTYDHAVDGVVAFGTLARSLGSLCGLGARYPTSSLLDIGARAPGRGRGHRPLRVDVSMIFCPEQG